MSELALKLVTTKRWRKPPKVLILLVFMLLCVLIGAVGWFRLTLVLHTIFVVCAVPITVVGLFLYADVRAEWGAWVKNEKGRMTEPSAFTLWVIVATYSAAGITPWLIY